MSWLATVAEFVAAFVIVLGAAFALIGSWGLVRLPTLMERLHGPTKATTLGVGGILVGSILVSRLEQGAWSGHELLITLFLFITAPIAARCRSRSSPAPCGIMRTASIAGFPRGWTSGVRGIWSSIPPSSN